MATNGATPPIFQERPTTAIVPDAWAFAALPATLALVLAALGIGWGALASAALAGFVLCFFRNPTRPLPAETDAVVAPADGRVLEVGEIEDDDGHKGLRIGIFLSIFDVHVNRAPLAGRVVAVDQRPGRARAAFDRRAEQDNTRATLVLETAAGERVRVVQIVGWIARRIVCHPRIGEWVERGARYGLIRFGSRTDVVLPPRATACVSPGQRVRGGETVVARLGEPG